jgi:hypothetical protein
VNDELHARQALYGDRGGTVAAAPQQLALSTHDEGRFPLTVRCPRCGAPAEEHCTTENGGYAPATHRDRYRAAKYKPNQGEKR